MGDGQLSQGPTPLLDDALKVVLLVDRETRTITYANRAALDLTPGQGTAADLDSWLAATGLQDLHGAPVRPDRGPLAGLRDGRELPGEPVADRDGRLLWLTASPLSGDPTLGSLDLVLLLDLRGSRTVTTDELALLRERAVVATSASFTITDPHRDDDPLIWVNEAFTRTTGYSFEDSVNRNCRFLQGEATDPEAVAAIRAALAAEESITTTLLNYRADGTPFWNQVSISPVFDSGHRLINFVGIQVDVSARVAAEQDRERALADERQARSQLALLSEITAELTATLDVEQSMRRLTELLVPALGDWCMVDLETPDGPRVFARHTDPALAPVMDVIVANPDLAVGPRSLRARAVSTGRAILRHELTEEDLVRATEDEVVRDAYRTAGVSSGIVLPLQARHGVLGALTVVTGTSGRRYSEADVVIATEVGRRSAVCIDNARLYEQEHGAAELLQRSLLPTLPRIDGMTVAAQYLVSEAGSRVGGDWYDVLALPDGQIALVVGDVMGHDLAAAAAMGQLRGMVRSYAWECAPPGVVLDKVDTLVQGLGVTTLATAFCARLDLATGDLDYASAGHPPAMVRRPDGTVDVLHGAQGVLLGAQAGAERKTASTEVPRGSLIALFTDGLVENRAMDVTAGMDRFAELLAAADPTADLESLCAQLVRSVPPGERSDDIALVLVRRH